MILKKINFITSNQGKIRSLQGALENYNIATEVVCQNLDLMEPQLDTVKEVSAYKAREAYNILKEPVLVEDGGFVVNALNGFPGVYTKYVLGTIGARGILKLMADKKNRGCGFVSCSSFVDENGQLYQFERDIGENLELYIASDFVEKKSVYAWSELWNILYVPRYGKTMCEFSKAEVDDFYSTIRGSLQNFADWLATQIRPEEPKEK